MYDVSMLSFGLVLLKKRIGGSALVAQLVSKMTAAASSFNDIIMRRVLGCLGSESVARTVRAEISRMVHQRPICKYMSTLQVMQLRGCLSGVVTVLWLCRRKPDSVLFVAARYLKGSSEQGRFKETLLSAPQLKTYALMLLSCAA
jgi:hypothetical protein